MLETLQAILDIINKLDDNLEKKNMGSMYYHKLTLYGDLSGDFIAYNTQQFSFASLEQCLELLQEWRLSNNPKRS